MTGKERGRGREREREREGKERMVCPSIESGKHMLGA